MASSLADSARKKDLANTELLLRSLHDVAAQSVEARRGGTLRPDDHGGVAVSIDSMPRRTPRGLSSALPPGSEASSHAPLSHSAGQDACSRDPPSTTT